MEPWQELLRDGRADAAWDALLARYQRLIFAAIRHYVADPDDVMDVFSCVCESLRADDLARLRTRAREEGAGAFSTWLVAVVRHRTVDWLRARDGRPRRRPPTHLSPLARDVYRLVFLEHRSHRDAFHLLSAGAAPPSTREFSAALAEACASAPALPPASRIALRRAGPLPAALALTDPADVEERNRLAEALASLSPDDRLAVELYVVDELAAAEVARIVGWSSPKTVYNRVGRALRALRRTLNPRPDLH